LQFGKMEHKRSKMVNGSSLAVNSELLALV
jgi:hypothetical protein